MKILQTNTSKIIFIQPLTLYKSILYVEMLDIKTKRKEDAVQVKRLNKLQMIQICAKVYAKLQKK